MAEDGNIIDKWKNFSVNKRIKGEILRVFAIYSCVTLAFLGGVVFLALQVAFRLSKI